MRINARGLRWAAIAASATVSFTPLLPASGETDADEVEGLAAEVAPELEGEGSFAPQSEIAAFSSDLATISVDLAEPAAVDFASVYTVSEAIVPAVVTSVPGVLAQDGAVVSETESGGALVVVPAVDAVRMQIVAESAAGLQEAVFEFPGHEFVETADGSLELWQDVGEGVWLSVGDVAPAWAYDANGAALETWYEADGETLVQHVEAPDDASAYPVVADPTVHLNGSSVTVRYNKAETRTAYLNKGSHAWIVASCAAAGGLAGSVGGPYVAAATAFVTGVYCGARYSEATNVITSAYTSGKCYQFTIYFGGYTSYGTWACKSN